MNAISNTWLGYALTAGVVSWLRFTGIVGSWPLLGVALALAAAGVLLLAAGSTGRIGGLQPAGCWPEAGPPCCGNRWWAGSWACCWST